MVALAVNLHLLLLPLLNEMFPELFGIQQEYYATIKMKILVGREVRRVAMMCRSEGKVMLDHVEVPEVKRGCTREWCW